jgi:hypothetical protein
MQAFVTKSIPSHHRAFDADYRPLTKDCRTEIELVQELRKLGVHLKNYSYKVAPADGLFEANTVWTKR